MSVFCFCFVSVCLFGDRPRLHVVDARDGGKSYVCESSFIIAKLIFPYQLFTYAHNRLFRFPFAILADGFGSHFDRLFRFYFLALSTRGHSRIMLAVSFYAEMNIPELRLG